MAKGRRELTIEQIWPLLTRIEQLDLLARFCGVDANPEVLCDVELAELLEALPEEACHRISRYFDINPVWRSIDKVIEAILMSGNARVGDVEGGGFDGVYVTKEEIDYGLGALHRHGTKEQKRMISKESIQADLKRSEYRGTKLTSENVPFVCAPSEITKDLQPGEVHALTPNRNWLLMTAGCISWDSLEKPVSPQLAGTEAGMPSDDGHASSRSKRSRSAFRFGFRPSLSDPKQPTPDPEEAKIVRFIFTYCLAGLTDREIAERLNHVGFAWRRRSPWNKNRVAKCLRDEAYKGEYVTAQRRYTVISVVPTDVWHFAQVQRQLRTNERINPAVSSSSHPVTRYLECGNCGASVDLVTGTSGAHNYRQCRKAGKECPGRRLQQEELDGVVTEFLEYEIFATKRLRGMLKSLLGKELKQPVDAEHVPRFAFVLASLFYHDIPFARQMLAIHVEKIVIDGHLVTVHYKDDKKPSIEWPDPLWYLTYSLETEAADAGNFNVHDSSKEKPSRVEWSEVERIRRQADDGEIDLFVDCTSSSTPGAKIICWLNKQRYDSSLDEYQTSVLLVFVSRRNKIVGIDTIKKEAGHRVERHIIDTISRIRKRLRGNTPDLSFSLDLLRVADREKRSYAFKPSKGFSFAVITRVKPSKS